MKKKWIGAFLLGCVLLTCGGCRMPKSLEGKEGVFAVMETSRGEIVLELFYKDTPLTVINFVGLAEGTLDAAKGKPFYDGLKFHRVISKANGDGQDFMIQGGDPRGNGTGGPGYKFIDEFVSKYTFAEPGMLAMANSGANTNGSQFFITIAPTEWLNNKHTIFGKVVDEESQKIVDSTLQNDVIKSVKIYRLGAEAEKFTATQADWNKALNDAKAAKVANRIEEVKKNFPDYEVTKDGIYFKVLTEGSGEVCGKGKHAVVEYKGYLVNGMLFDASSKFHPQGHEPLDFDVGAGEMIPGFDMMVQEMKVGEVRSMVIPSDLAYGDSGIPQAGIEGGAYICFDVELVSAK